MTRRWLGKLECKLQPRHLNCFIAKILDRKFRECWWTVTTHYTKWLFSMTRRSFKGLSNRHSVHYMGHKCVHTQNMLCRTVRANSKVGVAASCHLSLYACYRSIFVLTSLAKTRAGQSERRVPPAPLRTPDWSSRLGESYSHSHVAQLNTNATSFKKLYFP